MQEYTASVSTILMFHGDPFLIKRGFIFNKSKVLHKQCLMIDFLTVNRRSVQILTKVSRRLWQEDQHVFL